MWFRLVPVLVALTVASACEYDPAGFGGSLEFCDGEAATAGYGWLADRDPVAGSTYVGTDGDDVAIIVNGPVTYDAGAGNDLVCVNSWDPDWGTNRVTIRTGPGNDVIHGGSLAELVDAGPGLDSCFAVHRAVGCERVDGRPLESRIVLTTDKAGAATDGWVQRTDGSKHWVDATCRAALEARGLPVDVLAWESIDAMPDAATAVDCDELAFAAPDVFEVNARLGRGINLGNALEAPREGEWGLTLEANDFTVIAAAGFDHVRVPIRWSAYADSEAPYTIRDIWSRVDWVIGQAEANGLHVIINVHHYEELMVDPWGHAERFLALWDQIASRYAGASDRVLFELLNEPHGVFNDDADLWNDLFARGLDVVRRTNPTRPVVVGPVGWNAIGELDRLRLPDDAALIATVHFYEPFAFTHQGATWVSPVPPTGVWWDTSGRAAIEASLDAAAAWGRANDLPIFVGEFGAHGADGLAPLEARAAWTDTVQRAATQRQMSTSYWEFASSFGAYDRSTGWIEPLVDALID